MPSLQKKYQNSKIKKKKKKKKKNSTENPLLFFFKKWKIQQMYNRKLGKS